jgi:hypothetical protein
MPVIGPRITRASLLLAIGLYFLAVPLAVGQDAAKLPTLSLAPFRLSAVSQTSEGCGSLITAPAVQQNLEGQLRSVGINLSAIYNAQISTDLDCMAMEDGTRAAIAVHQCLAFSEVVSASRQDKPILASTWRKCQSYTCRSGNCDSQASATTGTLLGAFLVEFQRRTQAEATQFVPAITYNPPPKRNVVQFVFYTGFIMACLSVLFYGQWRRPRATERRAV